MLRTEIRLFSMQVELNGNVELNAYFCQNNQNSICYTQSLVNENTGEDCFIQ